MDSTTPQRSRLLTYGGRPIRDYASPGSTPPIKPVPAVSPSSRRGNYIPPTAEIQVPPTRGSGVPGAGSEVLICKPDTSPSVVRHSERVISSPVSSKHPIQQQRVSYSVSLPRAMDSVASPRSNIPTRAVTPVRKPQVEENTPASPVSDGFASSLAFEGVVYSRASDPPTAAEISPREIHILSQSLHATAELPFIPTSVPEGSPRFLTNPPAVIDTPMSPIEPSPGGVSKLDNVLEVSPVLPTHTTRDASSKLNLNVPHSGISRRPSPSVSVSGGGGTRPSTPSRGGGTRPSTPSRGGGKGNPDFASETPEQRRSRHTANQAVYDRMNPVLRQARSGLDAVRDWVAENGGVTDEDNERPQGVQQSEKVIKQTPEKVVPIVKEENTSVTPTRKPSVPNFYDQTHHSPESTPSESGIKQSTFEPVEAIASDITNISTLTNTSESDTSIARSNVAASVPVPVIRRLRKKASYYNLRAPETMTAMLRVTDEDFDEEIPARVLEAIKPVVNSFVRMGSLESYFSGEEEGRIEDEMMFEGKVDSEGGLSIQAVPSDERYLSPPHGDSLGDFDIDVATIDYRASTSTYEETKVPIDTSMSLAPASLEEVEVIPEQNIPVRQDSTVADVPFCKNQDQSSGLHPLIAAVYPWNPHFPGTEEEFGGSVITIPPPTTADGYLNEEEKKKVEETKEEQKQSVTLISAPQSLGNTVVKVVPEASEPASRSRLSSSSSTSRSSSSHSQRHSVARKTRRTEAMHKLNMRPTILSTISEEPAEEGQDSSGRDSKQSTRSSLASGIIQCQETMSEWLLSTAILDDRSRVWVPPVFKEKEFEVLEEFERLKKKCGGGRGFGVGNAVMRWGKKEEEDMERHLLPLRYKKVAAEELERERRALLKRWEKSDVSILEIPEESLRRLWDQGKGKLRSVTELSVEEVDLIVRETQRSAEGDVMRRVKLDATTVGSSRWLRMSPLAKRQFVKFNLTGLKDRMELAAAVRGGERRYKGRRSSETFVMFEARRRRENHKNAPPVLGIAVGRPQKEKRSLWTRCGEAVQGFFRTAVALSSQPKPKKEKVVERGRWEVVRAERGLQRFRRGESPIIAPRNPLT
ncbi:uncharacterized protein DFL_000041 [Arthrobotrys flagrans]|uniref:Uncharacterized protein n=1 Tax=Arthrobotrys flagrans TaxID=97331 RepID=A0A437ADZ4_ARTFL|nr:hypothetical protein DFL_000041 [Arthrobotrys flagrans]